MTILGIETSCDETASAILEQDPKTKQITVGSSVVASSLLLHAKTGGIIPEVAAREQLAYILPVINETLEKSFGKKLSQTPPPIDAIAVTYGPGLIGSLLVGVETARTLSLAWEKPIIPVNHMLGHVYANWIDNPEIAFPAIVLVVSGGHTDLLFLKNHGDFTLLGGTRDDAAGEAFDKIARLLGLSYPGGPVIEKLAEKGNPKHFRFPRPLLHTAKNSSARGGPDSVWDFSFSGLKTAVLREVQKQKNLNEQTVSDIARGVQDAICDVLVRKTLTAASEFGAKSILLSGGVAANGKLREQFEESITKEYLDTTLVFPERKFCTDNGAMIAAAALYNYQPVPWQDVTANPELYY